MQKKKPGKINRHVAFASALAPQIREHFAKALDPAGDRLTASIRGGIDPMGGDARVSLPSKAAITNRLAKGGKAGSTISGSLVYTSDELDEDIGPAERERRTLAMLRAAKEIEVGWL